MVKIALFLVKVFIISPMALLLCNSYLTETMQTLIDRRKKET
jgi:hypothetical protein